MLNKIVSVLMILFLFALVGCEDSVVLDENTLEETNPTYKSENAFEETDPTSKPENALEETNPTYKSLFVDYFKKKYPIVEDMVLAGGSENAQYYQSTEGKIYFTIGENSVEFTDWNGDYIKEAAYFGNISSLSKGQKVRIMVRDGFNSSPTMTIEELFNTALLLVKTADEECDYSYTDIDLNLFSSKNDVGGNYYEYAFSDKLTFMIEESIDNGIIQSRTLYCDIY